MRISDWSSDVCSSDLQQRRQSAQFPAAAQIILGAQAELIFSGIDRGILRPDPQEGEFLVDNALATVERGCADRPPFLRLAFILQMAIADRHAAPIPQREIEP